MPARRTSHIRIDVAPAGLGGGMIPAEPSRTALRVVMRRAAHQLLDRPPVLEDAVAIRMRSQFAVHYSQFAVRSSQFAVRGSSRGRTQTNRNDP